MKYPYIVNKNGVYYPAGTEVPEDKVENTDQTQTQNTNDSKTHTKTEINRMSVEDLKKLAAEQGVDGAEEMNGADLKKALIEKLGL